MAFTLSPLQVFFGVLLPGLMLSLISLNTPAATTVTEQINDLRAHYLALKNAQADFEQAKNRGKLGAAEQNDYAAWINQLSDQVLQDCSALQQAGRIELPDDLPCDHIRSSALKPATIDLATERTETEQTNGLITELNASLGEFDERLLQEQDRVKAQTPRTETGGGFSSSGSASAEGSSEQSSETASDGKQGNQDEGESAQNQTADGEEGQNTHNQTGTQGKTMPGSGRNTPEDIPDGRDDDVVARQLREAAEKETDPELREKLWEEYRRYKAGTG